MTYYRLEVQRHGEEWLTATGAGHITSLTMAEHEKSTRETFARPGWLYRIVEVTERVL